MEIINGKIVAQVYREKIQRAVSEMVERGDTPPHLVTFIVGDSPASQSYVRSKMKACEEVGFKKTLLSLPESTSEEEIIAQVDTYNKRKDVDGIIIQLPLPKGINSERVIMSIDPKKDVDGFHPENFGKMALGLDTFIPATPLGILNLLTHYGLDPKGKHTVIIGRSRIVGRPISLLLGADQTPGNSTVTTLHSHSQNIIQYTKEADFIVTALGVPNFLKSNMIKKGVVIIDVGINRVPCSSSQKGYTIKGDVDFEEVREKCAYLTPVPGGVGPMTVAMLLENTLKANLKSKKIL